MEHWWNGTAREKPKYLKKKVRFQLRPTRTPHEQAWARNRIFKGHRTAKTNCAMTRPEYFNLHGAQWLCCMFYLEG
jgi:hypothetical protein